MTKPLPTSSIKKLKEHQHLENLRLFCKAFPTQTKLFDIEFDKKTQLKNFYFSMKFIQQCLKIKTFVCK